MAALALRSCSYQPLAKNAESSVVPSSHGASCGQRAGKRVCLTSSFTGSFYKATLPAPLRQSGMSRVTAWFKFGDKGLDSSSAGIYGSQAREDFDQTDVEQYFNYMGMLATEGSYDKMDDLLGKGIHPVDILLLLAASEGDVPKIEELLRAGAKWDVEDTDGRTALDRAQSDEIRELIKGGAPAAA